VTVAVRAIRVWKDMGKQEWNQSPEEAHAGAGAESWRSYQNPDARQGWTLCAHPTLGSLVITLHWPSVNDNRGEGSQVMSSAEVSFPGHRTGWGMNLVGEWKSAHSTILTYLWETQESFFSKYFSSAEFPLNPKWPIFGSF
jgi:hypothetical protein